MYMMDVEIAIGQMKRRKQISRLWWSISRDDYKCRPIRNAMAL
jgi:hypothetical protein